MNTEQSEPIRDNDSPADSQIAPRAPYTPVTGLLAMPTDQPSPEPVPTEAPGNPVEAMGQEAMLDKQPDVMGNVAAMLDEAGQFKPEWWTHHADLSELGKTLKKFKSPEALAKSYAELEKIRTYPDPADEQRMNKFRKFLGLPEKEEEYTLNTPELGEGLEACWNNDLATKICATAHKYAIPTVALQAIADVFTEEQVRHYENYLDEQNHEWEARRNESMDALKEVWGAKCQSKLSTASSTLRQLCVEADIDASALAVDPVIGSNPEFIRLMDHVGRLLNDAPLKGSDKSAAASSLSEARRMESDPSHPLYEAYMDYNHPNHEYANKAYDRAVINQS